MLEALNDHYRSFGIVRPGCLDRHRSFDIVRPGCLDRFRSFGIVRPGCLDRYRSFGIVRPGCLWPCGLLVLWGPSAMSGSVTGCFKERACDPYWGARMWRLVIWSEARVLIWMLLIFVNDNFLARLMLDSIIVDLYLAEHLLFAVFCKRKDVYDPW